MTDIKLAYQKANSHYNELEAEKDDHIYEKITKSKNELEDYQFKLEDLNNMMAKLQTPVISEMDLKISEGKFI